MSAWSSLHQPWSLLLPHWCMPTSSHNTAEGSCKREHAMSATVSAPYRDLVGFQTLCNQIGLPVAAAAVPPFSYVSGVSCTGVPQQTTATQEQQPAQAAAPIPVDYSQSAVHPGCHTMLLKSLQKQQLLGSPIWVCSQQVQQHWKPYTQPLGFHGVLSYPQQLSPSSRCCCR